MKRIKENVNRDKSNNADMKVFHGAINAKNFLVNPKGGNVNKNDYKNIFNLDKEDNFVSTKKIQTGIKNNNNSISIFKINQINNNILNSNINNNNNNNNNNKEIIPPQIKPKLNKKINDNNNNKNNNDNENDILSFRNELSNQFLFSNQNNYPIENSDDDENNNNNKENKEQLLLKFKDITKEDEEIINNGFIPDVKENKKKSFRNLRNSQTSFKIANIEKGIALLVSSEDCIFTIPTFLLPKNCKIGTTYTFLVEEMNKPIQIKHKINVLQKNYLKDYNNNNNISNN